MAKIFYSLAGEGRGHATRVRAIVDELCHEHEIVLFTSHAAYGFLAELYADSPQVRLLRISGLQFAYRGDRLSYWKSWWGSIPFLRSLAMNVAALRDSLLEEQPDLIITDFEPLLPRAAQSLGLPFISFDHQHFLTTFDLSSLPRLLRWKAKAMASTIDCFYSGQCETIVSSFFSPGIRSGVNARCVGVMLRNEIRHARPTRDDFLLVYLRRHASPSIIQALRTCGRRVHVYGLGPRPRERNVSFFAVDESHFIDDLIHCQALLSNAGNQLVGEALYLDKPIIALPEKGNFEQAVNAHFLRQCRGTTIINAANLSPADVHNFLEYADGMANNNENQRFAGNDEAIRAIKRYLPLPRPEVTVPRPVQMA